MLHLLVEEDQGRRRLRRWARGHRLHYDVVATSIFLLPSSTAMLARLPLLQNAFVPDCLKSQSLQTKKETDRGSMKPTHFNMYCSDVKRKECYSFRVMKSCCFDRYEVSRNCIING
mmetsp:Transcript_30252/g.50000  ORF Transcript_30252/g.50000 Transcript_30252/m.50000 type:complete len:116 (-) Transcript_30252:8-355(-)